MHNDEFSLNFFPQTWIPSTWITWVYHLYCCSLKLCRSHIIKHLFIHFPTLLLYIYDHLLEAVMLVPTFFVIICLQLQQCAQVNHRGDEHQHVKVNVFAAAERLWGTLGRDAALVFNGNQMADGSWYRGLPPCAHFALQRPLTGANALKTQSLWEGFSFSCTSELSAPLCRKVRTSGAKMRNLRIKFEQSSSFNKSKATN